MPYREPVPVPQELPKPEPAIDWPKVAAFLWLMAVAGAFLDGIFASVANWTFKKAAIVLPASYVVTVLTVVAFVYMLEGEVIPRKKG
jgi:CHASE2 domain-containing sensor protein